MALKRVSDLQNRTTDEIQSYIQEMYDENGELKSDSKLFKSKIEVSESIDDDNSLFQSYAYDIGSLSGIIIDQTLNHDVQFNGNKTFTGDTIFEGSLIVDNDNNTGNNISIKTNDVEITSYNDFSLVVNNDVSLDVNQNISTTVNSKFSLDVEKTIDIKTNEELNLSSDNIINITGKNLTSKSQTQTLIYEDTLKIQFFDGTNYIDVVTFGHDNGKPTVKFGSSITATNPIDGYINHALWS